MSGRVQPLPPRAPSVDPSHGPLLRHSHTHTHQPTTPPPPTHFYHLILSIPFSPLLLTLLPRPLTTHLTPTPTPTPKPNDLAQNDVLQAPRPRRARRLGPGSDLLHQHPRESERHRDLL